MCVGVTYDTYGPPQFTFREQSRFTKSVAVEARHTTLRRALTGKANISASVFTRLVVRPQPVSLQPSMLRGAAYTNSTLSYLYAHWEVERTIALMTQLAP